MCKPKKESNFTLWKSGFEADEGGATQFQELHQCCDSVTQQIGHSNKWPTEDECAQSLKTSPVCTGAATALPS